MDVARYTFQSPYSSQIQIGKLDPSSVKQDEKSKQEAIGLESAKVEPLKNTQKQDVQAAADSSVLLDVYA